jgi:hypothetical protein
LYSSPNIIKKLKHHYMGAGLEAKYSMKRPDLRIVGVREIKKK